MRYLKTNTATIVTVGPFYDKTDGVTIEGSLTITNERISFTVDANDGSAPTLVLDNVTGATSGTANDLNYITGNDAGLMQLELSAANTNYLGRAFLSITDAANHVPVFHEFTILPAVVFDSLIAGTDLLDVSMTQILGTAVATPATAGLLDVNVKQISTDATAADNAELFFDGTGYAGGTTKLGVDVVAISGDTTSADNLEAYTDGTTPAPVNAIQLSGDATAADNAEAFFDGTGYAGTNNVIPTVTTTGTATAVTTVNGLAAGVITAASIATGAIDADALAADAVDEIVDEVVEGSTTLRQAIRLLLSYAVGKATGGGTSSIVFRDIGDTKDRITVTADVDGNRSAVTLDAS